MKRIAGTIGRTAALSRAGRTPTGTMNHRREARLIAEDRVSYVAPADYQPMSQLDVIVKGALGRIALRAGLTVGA